MLHTLFHRFQIHAREKLAMYGANPTLFTLFISIDYLVSFSTHSYPNTANYYWLLGIKSIGVMLCMGLLFSPHKLSSSQSLFPLYWYFTLLYCLPFSNTLFTFLLDLHNPTEVVHLAFSSILLIMLVDWFTSVILSLWGILLGIIAYELFIGGVINIAKLYNLYVLAYIHLGAMLIDLFFARSRQQRFENEIKASQLIGGAIGHEVRNAFNTTLMATQLLVRKLDVDARAYPPTTSEAGILIDKSLYTMLKKILHEVKESSAKGTQTIDMLISALRSHAHLGGRKTKLHSMRACIEAALTEYKFEAGQREKLRVDLQEDFHVQIVYEYYKHVLFNLLRNIYLHAGTDKVCIRLENRRVYIKDEGVGISAEDLPHIFDLFYTKAPVGTGIGLALCKYIMQALNGDITCRTAQGEQSFTEFVLHFPPIRSNEPQALKSGG